MKRLFVSGLIFVMSLLLLPIILLASEDKNHMTKVNWIPAISADESYPAELFLGKFEDASGSAVEMRTGKAINSGWGSATGIADISPAVKALPAQLDLQYFSYIENKFYGSKLDLPTGELVTLFKNGFDNQYTGKKGAYDMLLVGLGASGNVSIWVAGDQHVHEVITFEVPQIEVDWDSFRPSSRYSRNEFIKMMLSDLGYRGKKEDPRSFSNLKRQYPWGVEVIGDGPVGELRLQYLNGETDFFNFMRPIDFRNPLGMPEDARLTWSGTDGKKYVGNIVFDPAETQAAYQKLESGSVGKLRLELRIADTNRTVLVTLRDDKRFYQFEKAAVKVFRRKQ